MVVKDEHLRELFERTVEDANALDGEDRRRLNAHLAHCADCAQEFTFARRVREELMRGASGAMLSAQELERLNVRVAKRLSRTTGVPQPFDDAAGRPERARRPWTLGERSIPTPALAAAMAVALVFFWLSRGLERPAGSSQVQSALEFSGATGPEDVRRIQLDALAGLGGFPSVRLETKSHETPASLVIADFESISDLQRVVLTGFVQPELRSPARSGERALYLAQGRETREPVEVRVLMDADQRVPRVQAVSVWISCRQAPGNVSLTAGLASGGDCRAEFPRRVQQGGWRWVLFRLPAAEVEAGGGLADIRLHIQSAGPVLVDRIEVWGAAAP